MSFSTSNKNFIDITQDVERELQKLDIENGLLNLSVLHTSCSLLIQENADPSVQLDIKNFFLFAIFSITSTKLLLKFLASKKKILKKLLFQ